MTSWRGYDLLTILTKCGQRDNLKLCLDAGDAASYTSGQSWLDRSGNGYDFFRGADGSATATDPTFNGTAGRLSSGEYFSFDGGDYFTYDTTNETWMQNLHKDNAKFTVAALIYVPDLAGSVGIFCSSSTTNSQTGVALFAFNSEALGLTVTNGSGSTLALNVNSGGGALLVPGAWNFIAVAVDEAANAGLFDVNGTVATFSAAYTSPSSGNASNTLKIGALGTAALPLESTARLAMLAAWEGRALSAGELNAIHMATRARFGL